MPQSKCCEAALSEEANLPGGDDGAAPLESWSRLLGIVREGGPKSWIASRRMEALISRLCAVEPLTILQLAELLGRAPGTLRNHYLSRMIADGKLLPLYPDQPKHPRQAYRAAPGDEE